MVTVASMFANIAPVILVKMVALARRRGVDIHVYALSHSLETNAKYVLFLYSYELFQR